MSARKHDFEHAGPLACSSPSLGVQPNGMER